MSLQTTPHINFDGDARAALEFYRSAFGGQLALVTHADVGNAPDPAYADRISWGQVETDGGFRVMAYDVYAGQDFDRGTGSFFVSLRSADADEIQTAWDGLAEGAQVLFELGPAPWGAPLYGMLVDRFGVTWVLDVAVAWEG